jgi:hypothetical protein
MVGGLWVGGPFFVVVFAGVLFFVLDFFLIFFIFAFVGVLILVSSPLTDASRVVEDELNDGIIRTGLCSPFSLVKSECQPFKSTQKREM